MSRRPAFDPSRLDDLDDLLLPPPQAPAPAGPSPRPAAPAGSSPEPAGDNPAAPPEQPRVARSGGRPRRTAHSAESGGTGRGTSRPSVAAVRIPRALYDAVVNDLLGTRTERPSYAQLVAWTCEDHGDEVLAELAGAARQAARTPRGRRPAAEVVALTLRFRPEEWSSVERTLLQAQSAARAPVTRTAVVAAALGVAVRRAAT